MSAPIKVGANLTRTAIVTLLMLTVPRVGWAQAPVEQKRAAVLEFEVAAGLRVLIEFI